LKGFVVRPLLALEMGCDAAPKSLELCCVVRPHGREVQPHGCGQLQAKVSDRAIQISELRQLSKMYRELLSGPAGIAVALEHEILGVGIPSDDHFEVAPCVRKP
jgi:hypothetical protein